MWQDHTFSQWKKQKEQVEGVQKQFKKVGKQYSRSSWNKWLVTCQMVLSVLKSNRMF